MTNKPFLSLNSSEAQFSVEKNLMTEEEDASNLKFGKGYHT
jgi:hypothetical protein